MAVHCIVLAAVVTLPNGTSTPQGTAVGTGSEADPAGRSVLTRLAGA